jgi:predicted ATPase/DNA-binding XRE family transcriptional regulator
MEECSMSATDVPDFASLLRRYRRRSGLTQEELAERAGLSAASVSLLERGITQAPQRATVSLLSDALALSPDEAAAFIARARGSRLGEQSEEARANELTLNGELPLPLTALIGREREQAALLELLGLETTRLLTLTGPAGVGKTRLALELAATLRQRRHEDVVFVGLIPLREPERVLAAIARATDIHESDTRPLREALIHQLRDRALVLVLDNFEQVLPAARAVLDLLVACPRVKALVTSRSALNVRGEQCFPVAPLPLPNLAQMQSLEDLSRVPTVALFVDRAHAVWPDFQLAGLGDGRLVVDICERLDGLPLAIELAAARIRHFGLRALYEHLSEPTFLGMLAAGAQDLADHQRTMRSTIAWSYDLLSAEEQRVFRWLGVFVGGATHAAIESIIGLRDDALLAHMTALINASLVQFTDSSTTRRYAQLVTLQAFAQERLRAAGEWDEARQRHATYFLGMARQSFAALGNTIERSMDEIDADYENVRAALSWAWETGATMHGLRMVAALRRFWATHSYFLDGLHWLERFIARAGTPSSPEEMQTLSEAWTGVLVISHRLNRFERACDAGERALALRRQLGDKEQMAYAMMNLGNPLTELHQYERARALFEESLALQRELGNRQGQVFPLMNLAGLFYEMRQPRQALAYNEESLAISREVGETDYARALTWNNIGENYIVLDDPARAIEVTEPNYRLFVHAYDAFGAATCAFTLGRAEWRRGNAAAARAYLDEAEQIFRSLGNLNVVARIRYTRASLAVTQNDCAVAESDLLGALDDLSGQARAHEYIWCIIERAATLACRRNRPADAARLYAVAVSHRETVGGPVEPAELELRARDDEWLKQTWGEAMLASATAEGERLSLDEALAILARVLQNEPDDAEAADA